MTSFLLAVLCSFLLKMEVEAGTIYDSPYVSFSPDGKAWTTCAGDTGYSHYDRDLSVTTGIKSTLRALTKGEHYYGYERVGTLPLSRWTVVLPAGQCGHNAYIGGPWHGINYGQSTCMNYYYSGWMPFCADCDELVVHMCFYMSRESAASIDYLDAGVGLDYYYLCPHCTNLEQGSGIGAHICKAISWNQYRVVYDANTDTNYGGYMSPSYHMYHNATSYEGKAVTPVTRLTRNAYRRTGYVFLGWNTKADGSGEFYADEAEILNLTDQDYYQDPSAGTVTLYAQWRKAESTLLVDPAPGTYQGSPDIKEITQDYGTTYELDLSDIRVPAGHLLSFDTGGGNPMEAIRGTQHFAGWVQVSPFGGRLIENTYYFTAADGNVDTIKASYEPDVILLPGAERENSSFGGWYYDEAFERPAGGEGDQITITEDTTLYARWAELALYAQENYKAQSGKGAVDLHWEQPDNQGKLYKLYQSLDGENWTAVDDSCNTGTEYGAEKTFTCTDARQTYTVPHTGVYTLTAYGAQGGNYGSHSGGKGGKVSADFWLTQGEVLTYNIGGQNGYNGGGVGSGFANGGGYTSVSSDLKGDLIYAGGGGSATSVGEGGAGGSSQSVTSGHSGQSGPAGGGGGYEGGSSGELILHNHTAACYQDLSGNLLSRYSIQTTVEDTVFYYGDEDHAGLRRTLHLGSRQKLIPVNAGATLELAAKYYYFYGNQRRCYNDVEGSYLKVFDQNGRTLLWMTAKDDAVATYDGNSFYGEWHYTFTKNLSFTENTTGIYIVFSANTSRCWDDPYVSIKTANLKNMKLQTCGYTAGEVLSSKPAYGGSSWVNRDACISYSMQAGEQTGDGKLLIQGESTGYLDGQKLEGLPAPDLAAPHAVETQDSTGEKTVILEGVKGEDGVQIKISWEEPKDLGTRYYHRVESHRASTGAKLCVSNITENVLTTGIRGYYWLVDRQAGTVVTKANGSFVRERYVTVDRAAEMQYLHIAAVDGAGNLSETAHIPIDEFQVMWPLYTEALQIEAGDHVYYGEEEGLYYVRDDGVTPFTLVYSAGLEGLASAEYQPNDLIFESWAEGEMARNTIQASSEEIRGEDFIVSDENLQYDMQGNSCLEFCGTALVKRLEQGTKVEARQAFLPSPGAPETALEILPVAGARKGDQTVYSDYLRDRENSLMIRLDREPPEITGLEALTELSVIDLSGGEVHLSVSAVDRLSGVKELYMKVVNEDNHQEKIFKADENGVIQLNIGSGEEIFVGTFQLTVWASDNVGNVRELSRNATEFQLESRIERILPPHDPIFKKGESGILHITTTGYADRIEVEFPEELLAGNDHLELVYDYRDCREYRKEEQLQFMIPLDAPENALYKITVRVYKGNSRLEDYPSLAVMEVRGSILDELRTRLR